MCRVTLGDNSIEYGRNSNFSVTECDFLTIPILDNHSPKKLDTGELPLSLVAMELSLSQRLIYLPLSEDPFI